MYEQGLSGGRSAHDLPQISLACRGLGGLAYQQEDYVAARTFMEEALTAGRDSNVKFGIARSLNMLGDLARSQGDNAAARPLYEEAVTICRQLNRTYSTANILTNLGAAEFGEGNYCRRVHFAEGLTMHRESGDEIIGGKIDDCLRAGRRGPGCTARRNRIGSEMAGATERIRESLLQHRARRTPVPRRLPH